VKSLVRPVPEGFVLNVFKSESWTSHDAVQRVRRILGTRKVGHTGTLDPFATGVLLCCIGRATKLSNYLMDLTKEYVGAMLFGKRTSTGDVIGEVLEDRHVEVPSHDELDAAARRFEGEILQVPPMVSALKHHGRRLYELAREGITVDREPRKVLVELFEIHQTTGRHIRFRVRCARGTYVRTLVEDFGKSLGAGACVAELCRTAVGSFRVEDAIRLGEGQSAQDLRSRAIPMPQALIHLPSWKVPPFWVRKLRDGHAPPWVVLDLDRQPGDGEIGRLLTTSGELVALGRAVLREGRADRSWYDALNLELLRVI
jgi:tRNA pseudouridine55 synthase